MFNIFLKYLTHRTITKTETPYSSCTIHFSVCQTLNITQSGEALLFLYFYSVFRFYFMQRIMEKCKLENTSRKNHWTEVHNTLHDNFIKEMLEPD